MSELFSSIKHALTRARGPWRAVLAAAVTVGNTLVPAILLWPAFRPECAMRYAGNAANVEITGWAAGAICESLATGDPGWIQTAPRGAVICRLPLSGRLATIRVGPSMPIFGELMCDGFRRKEAR